MTKSKSKRVRRALKYQRQKRADRYATRLQRHATASERALRMGLRERGWKFEFQSVQVKHGGESPRFYIADFRLWLPSRQRLIVEVDGSSHDGREAYDARRTAWLERYKRCVVIRFTNEMVLTDLQRVLDEIATHQPVAASVADRTLGQTGLAIDNARASYAPKPCPVCDDVPTQTRLVVYKNGSEHRRWWCDACQRKVGGNPVPRHFTDEQLAAMFGRLG